MKSSGARPVWFSVVARKIMDGGKNPPSFNLLCLTVPGEITTAINDGHVTAAIAYGEKRRDDFRAGQEFFIREVLEVLQAQGFVGGDDNGYTWLKPLDGTWQIDVDRSSYRIFGQRERRLSADRSMLGERTEDPTAVALVGMPGRFAIGTAQPIELDVVGPRGGHEKVKLEVHPLAMKIPPMTQAEREVLAASIERDGVKVPIVTFENKILDGRHRGYFAAKFHKPVRVEEFRGTELEAKRLVATLNLHRRHLSPAQQQLVATELFGEEARSESSRKVGRPKKSNEKIPRISEEFSMPTRSEEWPDIVARKAREVGLTSVTADGARAMAEVVGAPETRAKVEAGEITTVIEARIQARKEKGLASSSLRELNIAVTNRRLGDCINRLNAILVDCGMPTGEMPRDDQFSERLTEIIRLAGEVLHALRQRKVI